jgi:hypothetical protein
VIRLGSTTQVPQ